MTSLREEIARLVDQDGYWQRMDGCSHALDTVTMTDDQRRQLTEVRDDERRMTAESSAIASAIIQLITTRLTSEEAVTAGLMAINPEGLSFADEIDVRAAIQAAIGRATGE